MSQNYQPAISGVKDANLDHIVGNFSGEKIMKPENEYAERQSLELLSSIRQKSWLRPPQMD